MKKVMMMALMAAAATTAFAQETVVKEAKKLLSKKDFDAAAQMLAPALTSSETLDKAAAWNLMTDIQFEKYSAIQNENIQNQMNQKAVPFDTLGMNTACYEALKAAIECDKYDVQPNDKGKVKIRFRQANQQRMQNVRLNLINAGLFDYNHKNLDGALAKWSLYLDSPASELFTGFAAVADVAQDQYRSEIAYYAGLVAYQKKDYATAEKFAKLASQDPKKAAEANEILLFSKKETMKTKEDSLAYVDMVKDLHKANPEEERYFNLLMEYYTRADDQKAMAAWAEEETSINPENKMAWALTGQVHMNAREWDAAVEAYKKAIEIDPTFIQCVFNAGVCLNGKAIDLKDKLADKNTGGLTKANADKVKAILHDAREYLERSKELDPDREKVNWAYPLYQIYYSIGDKAKSDEMEKLVNAGN
jgi:tetratricopeptide (TPR) repeat protein